MVTETGMGYEPSHVVYAGGGGVYETPFIGNSSVFPPLEPFCMAVGETCDQISTNNKPWPPTSVCGS